jgi:S-adenosylmethionine-diacylgycerolhomoserine-N-methlytransferase
MADSNHAALMDSVYRRQRYIYDLTRKYYLFGRDRLIKEMRPAADARIIEVGCGTSRNLIRIARRYPHTKLFGLDASAAMLETASAAVKKAGLESQISLAHGYAEALTPALFGRAEAFDEVVFSYSLSMIPDWEQALKAGAAASSSTGRIHIVDFGDLRNLPRPARSGLLGWLRLFHVEPRVELLATLEKVATRDTNLRVLPGRYAFLWTSPAAALSALNKPVAQRSQGEDKTPVTSS